jgi:hypothetical protein
MPVVKWFVPLLFTVGVLLTCVDAQAATNCAWTRDGRQFSTIQAVCPYLLSKHNPPEGFKSATLTDQPDLIRCMGTNGFDMLINVECTPRDRTLPGDAGAYRVDPTAPNTFECGATNSQVQALKAWIGRPLTSVPELSSSWTNATKPSDKAAIAALRSNPATNKAARQKYFDPTRQRFWKNVHDDQQARKLFEDSGFTFGNRGASPTATFGDARMSLNIDHIVRLADDPTKMLSPENLRIVSARENTRILEGIKSRDPFQDPQAHLERLEKNGGKPPKPSAKSDAKAKANC